MSLPKFREPAELQTFYINHSCHKTRSRRSLTPPIRGPNADTFLQSPVPAAYHSIHVYAGPSGRYCGSILAALVDTVSGCAPIESLTAGCSGHFFAVAVRGMPGMRDRRIYQFPCIAIR